MVKRNKRNGKKKKQQPQRRRRARRGVGTMLDLAAARWLQLLRDPCNAPLVAPCYAGFGTGNYARLKNTYNLGSVDGAWWFQPGTNYYWTGTTTTPGGSLLIAPAQPIWPAGTILDNVRQVRCIAACVKVRYVGPEADRKGVVSLSVGPPLFSPGDTTLAAQAQNGCPMVARLGEVSHEVKWVPSAADEEFHPAAGAAVQPRSSCMNVVYAGVPASSLQLEITACYELEGNASGGAPVTATMPPSSNTTNQVLQTLGDVASWAFTDVAAPVLKAAVHGGVQMAVTGMLARSAIPQRRYIT